MEKLEEEENDSDEEIKKFNSNTSIGERKRGSKYETQELFEFVVEEKHKGSNWIEITDKIKKKKGYEKITRDKVMDLHKKAIARNITISKTGGKQFTDYTEKLNNIYEQYINLLQRWVNAAENITVSLEKSDEVDDLKASLMIMKLSPQMKNVMDEVRGAMTFNREQQEKIILEQKNMVWSDEQINEKIGIILDNMPKEQLINILKNKK